MSTTASLTCAGCRQPARPFPAALIDGEKEMLGEVPFRGRLAYRCTKCDETFCARCCHPPELVAAMLKPGAIGLPHDPSAPFPGAACPKCRGLIRPFGDDELEDEEGPADDKPVTPGQRVGAGVFGLLVLVVSGASLIGGATVFGLLFGAFGLFMIGMAAFAK
jgi:hypothetical protein